MATGTSAGLETKFGTACCKLLAKYPLYRYREQDGASHYRLPVLLVGSAVGHLKDLLMEVLACGQLLDTALAVTVLSETAEADGRRFCETAPDLHRFISIRCGAAAQETEWELGSLEFRQGSPEAAGAIAAGYRYVFVSTGDDARDKALARSLAPHGGVLACTEGDDIRIWAPAEDVLRGADEGEKDGFMDQIHDIAHNLHFVYMKGLDVRETRAKIHYNYFIAEDKYNHLSDLEAALHVRSKLACCGIEEPDMKKAAALFAEKIRDPALLESLAELEHRRWCISKMLKGFYCPADVSGIYQNGNETHSADKTDPWHSILVPYRREPGMRQRLEAPDWDVEDVASIRDLDALDLQTLRIHKRCGALAAENREAWNEAVDALQLLFMGHSDVLRDHYQTLAVLRWAVEQLRLGKRSVVPLYKRSLAALRAAAPDARDPGPAWQELLDQLARLDGLVKPQIEYVIRKDYKELNRILVRQIPFALTRKKETVMLKLMTRSDLDCLLAPWQMEPAKVIYVGVADGDRPLQEIRKKITRMRAFLDNNSNGISSQYHILVKGAPVPPAADGITYYPLPAESRPHLQAAFRDVVSSPAFRSCGSIDYVDLTSQDLNLVNVVQEYAMAEGMGIFFVENGRIHNLSNAEELEYEGPEMDITVQEMFDKAGAQLIKTDSGKMLDGSGLHQQFWDVALSERDAWRGFCVAISQAYDATPEHRQALPQTGTEPPVSGTVTLCAELFRAMMPIFLELHSTGYLVHCSARKCGTGDYEVRFSVRSSSACAALCGILEDLDRRHEPGMVYALEDGALSSRSLRVSGLKLDDENGCYEKLLRDLAREGLIRDLQFAPDGASCSFCPQSKDISDILRNGGKVLEYYIYYSALLGGWFNDVDMSVFFHHSKEKGSVKNEVDVICTKGMSSLFISAKNVKSTYIDAAYITVVCNEVTVLADKFGVNAKRVLVAPTVTQFTKKGQRSKKVRDAQERGVYLVGDALCRGDKLGKVLRQIADGIDDWDRV